MGFRIKGKRSEEIGLYSPNGRVVEFLKEMKGVDIVGWGSVLY